MTITIAENPTATTALYPLPTTPLRFSYRETYAVNAPPFAPTVDHPYSARRASHPRGRSSYDGEHPDGASPPTVRRIDKSGLLGIAGAETPAARSGLGSVRFGTNPGIGTGMLSPRRFECVGQLDPVPEAGNAVASNNVRSNVSRTEQERREQRDPRRVDPPCRETLSMVDPTRPIAEFGDGGNSIVVGTQSLKSFEREFRSRVESSSSKDVSGCRATFQSQENCEARARTLERLSRLVQGRSDRRPSARYTETRCDFPFEVRGGTTYSDFEGSSSVPSNRAIASTVTTSTTTVAVSALGGTNAREEDAKGSKERAPEEERAEAEGCEHGPTRNPLKDGESSKRADEFADNDGIQTLRVIILSEQL